MTATRTIDANDTPALCCKRKKNCLAHKLVFSPRTWWLFLPAFRAQCITTHERESPDSHKLCVCVIAHADER